MTRFRRTGRTSSSDPSPFKVGYIDLLNRKGGTGVRHPPVNSRSVGIFFFSRVILKNGIEAYSNIWVSALSPS